MAWQDAVESEGGGLFAGDTRVDRPTPTEGGGGGDGERDDKGLQE